MMLLANFYLFYYLIKCGNVEKLDCRLGPFFIFLLEYRKLEEGLGFFDDKKMLAVLDSKLQLARTANFSLLAKEIYSFGQAKAFPPGRLKLALRWLTEKSLITDCQKTRL